MIKQLISSLVFAALLSSGAFASIPHDALADFNKVAGTNSDNNVWHYLTARGSTLNSNGRLLPTLATSNTSSAYDYVQSNNLSVSVPQGERQKWHDPFAYVGHVYLDTGIEGTLDGDGVRELITHLHLLTGYNNTTNATILNSHHNHTMLAFKPNITETTVFDLNFGIASDYHIQNGQDGSSSWSHKGMNLAFFLNDTQLNADTFWAEDNISVNGAKRASDEWVFLPPHFARFDDPIQSGLQLEMEPGDTFYLRVHDNGNYIADGLVLTEASAIAVPEPAAFATSSGLLALALGILRRCKK